MSKQTPIVQQGNAVRFWSIETGLDPQMGKVEISEIRYGSTYAVIIPDKAPQQRVHLFHKAVWGFEPL